MNCHKKQMFTKTVNLDTFLEDLDGLKGLEGRNSWAYIQIWRAFDVLFLVLSLRNGGLLARNSGLDVSVCYFSYSGLCSTLFYLFSLIYVVYDGFVVLLIVPCCSCLISSLFEFFAPKIVFFLFFFVFTFSNRLFCWFCIIFHPKCDFPGVFIYESWKYLRNWWFYVWLIYEVL